MTKYFSGIKKEKKNGKGVSEAGNCIVALVTHLAPLAWFQFWPPDGATCISNKFGHQVALLALPHCLWLPYRP